MRTSQFVGFESTSMCRFTGSVKCFNRSKFNMVRIGWLLPLLLQYSLQQQVVTAADDFSNLSERELLIQFYQQTHGDQWLRSDHWTDPNVPICQWYGVSCEQEDGQADEGVRALALPNNNVIGAVYPGIYHLTSLTILNLKQNPITNANFVMGLVDNNSNHLAKLEVIDFEDCLLSHVDGISSTLITLRELRLSRNSFRQGGFPSELLKVASLDELYLSNCDMTGPLPSDFSGLSNLEILHLNHNYFTGVIPSSIGQALPFIKELNLAGNELQGPIPSSPGVNDLQNLVYFNLEHQGSGSSQGSLSDGNPEITSTMTGPLPSFNQAPNLRTLLLSHNALSGAIPSDILAGYKATGNDEDDLVILDVSHNQLKGRLSEDNGSGVAVMAQSLERIPVLNLDITENQLHGPIPQAWCSKTKWMNGLVQDYGCDAIACESGYHCYPYGRQHVDENACQKCPSLLDVEDPLDLNTQFFVGLSECDDSKPPPNDAVILAALYRFCNGRQWTRKDGWEEMVSALDAFGDMDSVDFSSLGVCQLYGVICNNEGMVSILQLHNNNLVGTIPWLLFHLPHLISLDLSDNNVDLLPPDEEGGGFTVLQHAKKLTRLKLSNTMVTSLTGISHAKQLTELHLDGCNLSGDRQGGDPQAPALSGELFELTELEDLSLEACLLNGTVPSALGQLVRLKKLTMNHNKLVGSLPTEVVALQDLELLDLSENLFSGGLPPEWNDLKKLSILRVYSAGPQMGGALIPFTHLDRVEILDLSRNSFTGPIPANFLSSREPTGTVHVKLDRNSLSGTVPASLSSFSRLFLELQDNMITGIDSQLCQKNDWMLGEVGLVPDKCDAILCAAGSWSPLGRSSTSQNVFCSKCDSNDYFGSTTCVSGGVATNPEVEILNKLYYSTEGPFWTKDHTNWTKPEVPICFREGIRCNPQLSDDYNSGVIEVYLNRFGMRGVIPSEIFDLPHIRELGFSFNHVDISFERIGNAKSLETLLLSGTNVQSLKGIENAQDKLFELHVAKNAMKGLFPSELLYIGSLERLFLSDNLLSGTIPVEIGLHMKRLKSLNLSGNRFIGFLPSELGTLPELVDLFIQDNLLSGLLPTSLNNLEKLERINLSGQNSIKKISGPLIPFASNPALREVDLSSNSLAGTIPSDLFNSVDRAFALKANFSRNELFGVIPVSLDAFDKLSIDLSANMISYIPNELCNKMNWMDGVVALMHPEDTCNAILCPPGTFLPSGMQKVANDPCRPCETKEEAPYYGSVKCEDPFTADNPCVGGMPSLDGSLGCSRASSERSTLELLFATTWGGGWSNKTKWMTEVPICSWGGVVCEGDPHDDDGVLSIDLSSNGLSGTIPPELWHLPKLQSLNVKGNPELSIALQYLPDKVPVESLLLTGARVEGLDSISKAKSLKVLSVSGASGPFPESFLSLKALEHLDIRNNFFVGTLPAGLANLGSLEVLDASGNDFHGPLPVELCRHKRLQELFLDDNLISGALPAELSSMPNLRVLSIARRLKLGRVLSGSLPAFDKAPNLEFIALNGNELSGSIPTTFAQSAAALRKVDISDNLLTGSVPESLDSKSRLELVAVENKLTGLSPKFCDNSDWMGGEVGTLGTCDTIMCPAGSSSPLGRTAHSSPPCRQCPDAEVAPPFFGQTSCDPPVDEHKVLMEVFEELGGTNWHRRDFWGSNTDICNWYGIGCDKGRVVLINLRANNLVGKTPESLFELPELEVLILSSNPIDFQFIGIGKAKNLLELRVDSTATNSLTGIGEATKLTVLDASFNDITGPFPREILEIPNLRTLLLRENQMSGELPSSWSTLRYLRILRLDGNNFSGPVPAFPDSHALAYIYLGGNGLDSTIPTNFLESTYTNQRITIDLSSNKITGAIPSSLVRFDDVTIYLRNNSIAHIPDPLCKKASWNNGDVGKFGCDGLLCGPGFSNAVGRRSEKSTECLPCSKLKGENQAFFGQTVCAFGKSSAPSMSHNFARLLMASLFSSAAFMTFF